MKFGENQSAMRTVAARTLLLSAVAALTLGPLLPVVAAESEKDPVTTSAIGPVKMRFLSLGIGKSVVVDLPRDVKDVLVADPKIANAVVRSSQRAYIIGGAVGQTNVVFFDADGQQVASYDIAVKRDLNGVRAALRQSLPGIQIEGVGDSVDADRLGVHLRSRPSRPARSPRGWSAAPTRSSTRSSFAAATR